MLSNFCNIYDGFNILNLGPLLETCKNRCPTQVHPVKQKSFWCPTLFVRSSSNFVVKASSIILNKGRGPVHILTLCIKHYKLLNFYDTLVNIEGKKT